MARGVDCRRKCSVTEVTAVRQTVPASLVAVFLAFCVSLRRGCSRVRRLHRHRPCRNSSSQSVQHDRAATRVPAGTGLGSSPGWRRRCTMMITMPSRMAANAAQTFVRMPEEDLARVDADRLQVAAAEPVPDQVRGRASCPTAGARRCGAMRVTVVPVRAQPSWCDATCVRWNSSTTTPSRFQMIS